MFLFTFCAPLTFDTLLHFQLLMACEFRSQQQGRMTIAAVALLYVPKISNLHSSWYKQQYEQLVLA